MIDFNKIIERIKNIKQLNHNKDVADLFSISPSDFSLRKKRGTLLPLIIEWAIDQCVNTDWLITGKGDFFSNDKAVSSPDVISYENQTEAKLMKLVKTFENKELALELTEDLKLFEQNDPEMLLKIKGYFDHLKYEKDVKNIKSNNTKRA